MSKSFIFLIIWLALAAIRCSQGLDSFGQYRITRSLEDAITAHPNWSEEEKETIAKLRSERDRSTGAMVTVGLELLLLLSVGVIFLRTLKENSSRKPKPEQG